MEDNSFDPRTWPLTWPRTWPRTGIDARDGTAQPGAAFPLATTAALRLWLASALVLAIAAAGAWAMPKQPDAGAPRLAVSQAAAPADHGQAPAP